MNTPCLPAVAAALAVFTGILPFAPAPACASPLADYSITRVRFFPREGKAAQMKGGKFTGSNEGPTTSFETFAEIKEAPPEGQWSEITVEGGRAFRYVKYESPLGSWGNVAEIEFHAGDAKLTGAPFGTAGSRDDSGSDFAKALDGDTGTYFEGKSEHNQYVGLDLGPDSQCAPVELSVKPGTYADAQAVELRTATPGATIRFTVHGTAPRKDDGIEYGGPVAVPSNVLLIAAAFKPGLAPSPLAMAPFRITSAPMDADLVRTFHIGNSLTDTVVGWLQPLAESAGKRMDFRRFTIPGAPTDWLWTHPGTGFGDNRVAEQFVVLAPIHHIFTQPFAGHGRSVENEAQHSGMFFEECRKSSPDVQPWLYVQWPGPKFEDAWAQARGEFAQLGLAPAATWHEAVANHVRYTEAVRDKLNATWRGRPALIVPGGPALADLKTQLDAAKIPGLGEFFAETYADGIHMTAKGRYLISLVHYACIYKESPEGKVSALNSGLSEAQAREFQRIAWAVATSYPGSGVKN